MIRRARLRSNVLVLVVSLASQPAYALTTRCVADVAQLDAAIKEWTTIAADADPRFVVQMQVGSYPLPSSNASGVYQYDSTTPVSLELLGGYSSGCASRVLDARNTVIDGDGLPNARLHLFNVNRDVLIEGISFTGLSGGVQMIHRLEAPASGHRLRVSHARIVGNSTDFLAYTLRLWGFGDASGAEVMLDNSLIADNLAGYSTPVLLSTGTNGRIVVSASTLTGNAASSGAAALTLQHWNGVSGLDIVYDSSIAWNNGTGVYDLDVANAPAPPAITHGLIGSLRGGLSMDSSWLEIDPQLANPAQGEYRLALGSPALDAGNPTPADALAAVDLFGRPRVQGGAPDLGAFEGALSEQVFGDGFE